MESYEPHNYTVTADLGSKQIYKSSDKITLAVDAKYYFGQPVANANVEVVLYIRDSLNYFETLNSKLPGASDYDFYVNYYTDPDYAAYSSIKLKTVKAKLDSKGHAVLTIPYTIPEAQAYGNGKTISAEVKVVDSLGDTEYHTYYATVAPKGGNIGAVYNKKDGLYNVIYTDELLKEKAGRTIKASVYKSTWSEVLSKDINGVYSWSYKENRVLVSTKYLTTNSAGKTSAQLGFKPEDHAYEIVLSDSFNSKISNTIYFSGNWDYSGGYYDMYSPDNQITVKTDKTQYKVGEKIKVTPVIEGGKYKFLASVEKNGLLEYKVYSEKELANISFDVKEEDQPNIFLSVIGVKTHASKEKFLDYRFGLAEVKVSVDDKKMSLNVKTDKNTYLPGDKLSLEVASAKAEKTEYMVAVIDKAVLDLQHVSTRTGVSNDMFEALWSPWAKGTSNSSNLTVYENKLISEAKWGQKGGAGGGEDSFLDSLQAEDIRNEFKDAAVWMPAVVGADGKIAVSFNLPDNLTTWNIFVIGYTADGKIGAKAIEVPTSKDMNLLSNIPGSMYVTDQVEFMYNASFGSDILKKVGGDKLSVEIKSRTGKVLCGDKYQSSCVSK